MKIQIVSAHRNNEGRAKKYMEQAARLRDLMAPEHDVVVLAVVGDETDNTWNRLVCEAETHKLPIVLVRHNHGGPVFGSVESPERMTALSGVVNKAMENVDLDTDVILYVESDLIWSPDQVASLIYLCRGSYEIVAPLVMAGEHFYDVWGYRGVKGDRFGPYAPYHHALKPEQLTEVSSVGSCFASRGDVARLTRVNNNNALVGWCDAARAQGYRIAVWPESVVRHPA